MPPPAPSPAFPLSATVAINPFLGQVGEEPVTTAARLGRVAGVRLIRPRSAFAAEVAAGRITAEDLATALIACTAPVKPRDLADLKARLAGDSPAPAALPMVADLVTRATGTDWPAVIARSIGLWAAGRFDRGQALWSPADGRSAFAAWREWATHDLTPEIAGLTGFCAHVADAPDTPERTILRAAERLSLSETAAPTAFHRLPMDLGGWAQHARWLPWQAESEGGSDATLTDLLAIRLIWEEALLAHAPQVANAWAQSVADHSEPVAPTPEQVLDAILQEAFGRAASPACSQGRNRPRAGPRCRPPSASTCAPRCSAARSRHAIRGSRRRALPGPSGCRWRIGHRAPTKPPRICRCC